MINSDLIKNLPFFSAFSVELQELVIRLRRKRRKKLRKFAKIQNLVKTFTSDSKGADKGDLENLEVVA